MASSSIKIKYTFGENIDAVAWRAEYSGHMDDTCERILTRELSAEEVEYLKNRNDLIWRVVYGYLIRDKKLPIFPPPEWQRIQIQCYLCARPKEFRGIPRRSEPANRKSTQGKDYEG